MFFKLKNSNSKSSLEYLIIGLGNPGSQYEKTRHNAGFMAIDYIAESLNVEVKKSKFNALFNDVKIGNKRCLLIKPHTYMNLSGEAIGKFFSFYKIPVENIIVFFDDISLTPGKIRIRRKGSHGGHNGIKSIINILGSDNFPRIKIGVGNKPDSWDLADWVLSKFNGEELEHLNRAITDSFDALKLIVAGNINEAMSKYN